MLSRAITLIESNLDEDKNLSAEVLEKIIHATGNSIRVGITGVPGVGKSSFIEAIGQHIMSLGKKLAVLTIDPSSHISKGSILGDKTRMEHLSRNPLAFIRPSPSGKLLGGITEKTHEVILLCEAAGYEVIIVETVGVGQSEVSVNNLVDFFLLLMLAGAGDEMQGIKRGITEIADAIVITKSDGENIQSANLARATYEQSLHLNANSTSGWTPKVTTASSLTGTGIKDVWQMILSYKEQTDLNGFFNHRRKMQTISLFHESFDGLLRSDIEKFKSLDAEKRKLEGLILDKKISAQRAAQELLHAYHQQIKNI
jgi:LAO/AO transport system kinase